MRADQHIDLEEAERQLRAVVADIHDPVLDAFLARIPTMKTSDLIGFMADASALAKNLCMAMHPAEDALHIGLAAIFAIKDEIDRRFPISRGGS